MSDRPKSTTDPAGCPVYQIKIGGHLDASWEVWFTGLALTWESDGDSVLRGPVADQAALHGLLKKVRDLGLPLVSVNRIDPGRTT